MKEFIPIKKDIIFKSKIYEITNINLDHEYKVLNDIIEGTIFLTGSYKMTEASVVEEDYIYNIPFSIAISKRINKDTIKIDIEDFKYEISKDILRVNINLELNCEEEIENEIINEINSDILENNFNDNILEINKEENSKEENINDNIINNINNITKNIVNNTGDEYYTYKVYIVRKNDTLENICEKFNITLDDIKLYNDIENINVGDKILIPKNE